MWYIQQFGITQGKHSNPEDWEDYWTLCGDSTWSQGLQNTADDREEPNRRGWGAEFLIKKNPNNMVDSCSVEQEK